MSEELVVARSTAKNALNIPYFKMGFPAEMKYFEAYLQELIDANYSFA